MENITNVKIETISPDDGYNYFFGYYDLQPYDVSGKRHLAHRVSFHDRLPKADDICELGYITIEDRVFHKVAESCAWNFQQGCMLQWFDDESIIFNDFRDGAYCAVIKQIKSGEERLICAPIANLSQDRRWGLSVNFSRIWNFRPGYGYCNIVDPYFDVEAPEEDGIFLVDIENNTSKLILSYKQMSEAFPEEPYCSSKLVVNHITFNPSASRFLVLLRNFKTETQKKWATLLFTADRDGGDLYNISDYESNSHYHWKNDEEFMIFGGRNDKFVRAMIFHTDKSREYWIPDNKQLNDYDIHCLYHPDKTCFIGDIYPQCNQPYRGIVFYDLEKKVRRKVANIYACEPPLGDCRCDLHTRFNRDGSYVSFDCKDDVGRTICQFKFDKEAILACDKPVDLW